MESLRKYRRVRRLKDALLRSVHHLLRDRSLAFRHLRVRQCPDIAQMQEVCDEKCIDFERPVHQIVVAGVEMERARHRGCIRKMCFALCSGIGASTSCSTENTRSSEKHVS